MEQWEEKKADGRVVFLISIFAIIFSLACFVYSYRVHKNIIKQKEKQQACQQHLKYWLKCIEEK